MDRELIEAKKIEIEEFIVETLGIEEFPQEWESERVRVFKFLKKLTELEADKEITDMVERNKVLIKLIEHHINRYDREFLIEDYKAYLNTGDASQIFLTTGAKFETLMERYQDAQIVEMIESGQIWVR